MVGEGEGNFPVPAALAAWLPCHAQQVVGSPEGKRMLCERKREQSLNHICCVFLFCHVKFCYLCFFLFLFYLGNKCRCTSLPGNAERFLLLLMLQGCVSFLSLFASSPSWAEVRTVCPLLLLSNQQMWFRHLKILCLSKEKGNL